MAQYDVVVASAQDLTPTIRELVLRTKDGAPLPAYEPGAHIEIELTQGDGKSDSRAYSLIGGTATGEDSADAYRIAVECRADSAGGSRHLHGIALGTPLGISAPRNNFPLGTHKASRLLVAGGVGIAPIYAMARRLRREGLAFEIVFIARDPNQFAYRAEVAALAGGHAIFHDESAADAPFDVNPLVKKLAYPSEVYVCGSHALNKQVVAAANAQGLSKLQIHEQCFVPPPPAPKEDNAAFEVLLRLSGLQFSVPEDSSILETMLANGHTPRFYCGRGECGICPMTVVSADGPIEHRDHVLKPQERDDEHKMCICVSRIKGTRLVLDG